MTDPTQSISRRAALRHAALASIAVVAIGLPAGLALAADKKKEKAAKDDFFFQDEPGENGKSCKNCINFTPKSAGQYGADSGDCALLEGDVCNHCYCQGWTDKNDPKAKKAGA